MFVLVFLVVVVMTVVLVLVVVFYEVVLVVVKCVRGLEVAFVVEVVCTLKVIVINKNKN